MKLVLSILALVFGLFSTAHADPVKVVDQRVLSGLPEYTR
jgi:hypothetical protein